ncbi:MAG: membrane-bound lytic murein transglycosylase MltF [Gammaproteobacteria bacterium]|nr:membrane-bound lytic murein transglycosylase MltF [Gammaproteobacteria bacterium]
MQKSAFSATLSVLVLVAFVVNASTPPKTLLERVKESGELHVVTRNAPTTYYEGAQGPAGLEYDLIQKFAEYLGVRVDITVRDNLNDILTQVEKGSMDFAAAGLTVTDERKNRIRFSTPYQYITQQAVYNRDSFEKRPREISDFIGHDIQVLANSSHVEQLKQLKVKHPELSWSETYNSDSSELLDMVARKLTNVTIADSNEVTLYRRYHPELRVAMNISKKQALAWAFNKGADDSLYKEAQNFFKHLKKTGELTHLIKRHYHHASKFRYTSTNTYLKNVRKRLPRYQSLFEKAAMANKLDWRLVAAVSYQESLWNPHAVSFTGVRGMMMLTTRTARQLGIKDRTDTKQSIDGGARYLRKMIDKVEAEYGLKEPERTWFALASYNVGFGHLTDARMLTRLKGKNPDKWTDVKEVLPLLRQRKWYRKTRFGFARGEEPVKYVEAIRSYYDILNWYLDNGKPKIAERSILAFKSSAL